MIRTLKLKIAIIFPLLALLGAAPVEALEACETGRYDHAFFESLKENNFTPRERIGDDLLVLMLANCLGDPDPVVRDGIAYEGIAELLRRGRVSNAGVRRLLDKCEGYVVGEEEGSGFLKPFAALCIAEVARTDRIKAHFNGEARARLVKIGTKYMKSITDYRGFDQVEGWRHGVAHTADVLMQLSLNDNIGLDHHREMLNAIASQISPKEHFYRYGEPARLARPVLFMAMQGTIAEDEWTKWFSEISKPDPEMESWVDAFSSQARLAKRHNVMAFLSALYLNAGTNDNENIKMIMPGLMAAIQEIP